jgi:hypothetical protein
MKPIVQISAAAVLAATILSLSQLAFATQQGNDTNSWIKFCSLSPKCHWRLWPHGDSVDIIWGGQVFVCPMPPGPCTPLRVAPPKNVGGFPGDKQGNSGQGKSVETKTTGNVGGAGGGQIQ